MSFTYDLNTDKNSQIVHLKGRILDRSEADQMLKDVSQNIDEGKTNLIFNFKELDYMNSAGLNVLISILTKSRNHYGEMVLCELSDKVQKLLVTSKLQNIFKLVDSEQEAREKLNI